MEMNDYFNYDDEPRVIVKERYINQPAPEKKDDEKIYLYFIIVLLILTIIIMNTSHQNKMFELMKKQVKVI